MASRIKTRLLPQEASLIAHTNTPPHGTTCHCPPSSQVLGGPLSALPEIMAPLGTPLPGTQSETTFVDGMNEKAVTSGP